MSIQDATTYHVYWRRRPDTFPRFIPGVQRVNFSNSVIGFSRGEFGIEFLANAELPTFVEGGLVHIYEVKSGVEKLVFTGVMTRPVIECTATDASCEFPTYSLEAIYGVELTYYLLELLEHAYAEDTAESALNLDVGEFADRIIRLNHIAPTAARYAPFAHTFTVNSTFTALGPVYEADVSEMKIIDIMEDLVDFALWNGVFMCIRCEIPNPRGAPMQVNFVIEESEIKPVYLSRSNGTISAQIDEDTYGDAKRRVIVVGEDNAGNPLYAVDEFLDAGNSLINAETIVNGGNNDTVAELTDLASSNLGSNVARRYNFVTLNRDGTAEVYDTWGPCDRVKLESCRYGDVIAWISAIFTDWSVSDGVPVHDVELCTVDLLGTVA